MTNKAKVIEATKVLPEESLDLVKELKAALKKANKLKEDLSVASATVNDLLGEVISSSRSLEELDSEDVETPYTVTLNGSVVYKASKARKLHNIDSLGFLLWSLAMDRGEGFAEAFNDFAVSTGFDDAITIKLTPLSKELRSACEEHFDDVSYGKRTYK